MRLLVVDDAPGLAEALSSVIGLQYRCSAVAIARNYEEGVSAALLAKPDVALLDQHLGRDSRTGLDVAVELRRLLPGTRLILMTAESQPELAARALWEGVDAVVLKGAILEGLADGMGAAINGRKYIAPQLAPDVAMLGCDRRERLPDALSPAEMAVLQGIAEGRSAEEIADRRGRTIHTVKSQRKSLYRKLGARCREQAIRVARGRRLL